MTLGEISTHGERPTVPPLRETPWPDDSEAASDRATSAFAISGVDLARETPAGPTSLDHEAESLAHLGSFEWDLATNELRWSDELYRVYGYAPREVEATFETFLEHVHPDDRARVRQAIGQALRDGGRFRLEERIVRKDGELRVLESCGQVLPGDDGRPARIVGACLDITDRKRTEQALLTQSGVLERIASGAELREVLEEIVRLVEDKLPGSFCSVHAVDRTGEHLKLLAGRSLPGQYNAAVATVPIGPSAGSCGTAAHRGETVVVSDIALDPLWDSYRHLASPHALRSCVSTPIFCGDRAMGGGRVTPRGRVLGTFALYARHPGSPNPGAADVLRRAAYLAGVAIEREAAHQELRDSHAFQESIIHTAAEGICVGAETSEPPYVKFTVWNDRMTALTGYTREEINRLGWVWAVHPDDSTRRRAVRRLLALRAGDDLRAEEWVITRKDGEQRTVSVSTSRVQTADDEPAIVAMMQDVTERHEAEEALRASEQRYRGLVETSHDLIWAVDEAGHWTFLNREATQAIYGRTPEEMLGLPFADSVAPECLERDMVVFERLLDGKPVFHLETRHFRADGTVVDLSFNAIPVQDDSGRVVGTTGTAQDISDRKRTEREARRQIEGLRILSKLAADLLAATDPIAAVETLFTSVSDWLDCDVFFHYLAEGEMLRLAAAGGIDGATRLAFSKLELGEAFCGTTARLRLPLHVDRIRIEGDPEAEPLLRLGIRAYSCHPLIAGDRLIGTLAFASRRRDRFDAQDLEFLRTISHYVATAHERLRGEAALRDAQEHVRQSQKLQAIGQLAGGLAHDLNNILTVINGYSELLLSALAPESTARGPVTEIREAGERAAALTRQLLAIGRRQILAPTVLSLNEVVTGFGSMLRRLIGANIRVQTRLAPDLRTVSADRAQMEQILMNLAVNARDAMSAGGTLTISTRNFVVTSRTAHAVPAGMPPGEYVLLEVADTGEGMTPEVRSRIFEPFFSTKSVGAGTGLGLATVHGIVHQSGGQISVHSSPGAGAAFRVYLPALKATSPQSGAPRVPTPGARGEETILLVEDEDGVRGIARRLLDLYGYKVLEAANGEEAVELIEDEVSIDLMITDLMMPGMNGRDLARLGRARRPGLKTLFISAYAGQLQDGFEEGQPFLQKPFTADALTSAVRKALDTR